MLNRFIMFLSLICLVILVVMMNLTTPTEIGPLGVLVFFTTVYLMVFGMMVGAMMLFRKVTMKKGKMLKKDYAYAAAIAMGPIMLLLAHSVGTEWWLAILGVGMFVILFCFVISKRL
ncbi:hypothetical protein IJ096_01335 [Candidatus Saccharibacteria bacterium]|nr:hypothetical protein [Candidatus Saccharibacteria bacterium]